MKRNLMLIFAILISVLLVVKSSKRILSFRDTSAKVGEENARLEKLRVENQQLKQELEYKKSNEFVEGEIRNKLGLAKDGETVVILPQDQNQDGNQVAQKPEKPNWQKWKDLFFGT